MGPNSIAEFRTGAHRALPRMIFDFIDGGSGSEATMRENRAALDRLRLVARAPVDVSQRSTAVELFGNTIAAPIVTLYAAAVAGEAGVFRALEILRSELDAAMALVGARNPSSIGADRVRPRVPVLPQASAAPYRRSA